MTEQARRRRRRRRGRRGGGGEADLAAAPHEPRARPLPAWDWRTFPVFAAFAVGVVVMGLFTNTGLALAVFLAGVFGVALSAAHIVTRQIIARRRRR